jgi:hypothetical protein
MGNRYRWRNASEKRALGPYRAVNRLEDGHAMFQQPMSMLSSLATALGLAGLLFLTSTPTLAHERRDVGKYQFVVGFITEPALQGEPNGIDLRITDRETQQPVVGAERSLKANVAFGAQPPREFPLRARFQMPGSYTADLIPTRSGAYIFTFAGEIDGQQVNERFESGPGRFDEVKPATALMFPVAEPSAADLQQSVSEARQQAATANTIALVGVAAGVLALLLAGYLLLTRRSATQAHAMAPQGSRAD